MLNAVDCDVKQPIHLTSQELCVLCKRYIENKQVRTMFTYNFVIDTI